MKTSEEELELEGISAPRLYTIEEVRAGLDALRDDEKAKLRRISWALSQKAGMHADELYQEAVVRMLTTRTCSSDVSVLAYAAGVMRSIASDAYRATSKAAAAYGLGAKAANDEGAPVSKGPTPDDELIERARQQCYRDCIARIESLIDGDEPLQALVAGLEGQLRGKELEDFVGTDTNGLAAVKKRLARLRAKAFPKGSPFKEQMK